MRALLDSDVDLYEEVVEQLQIGQEKITWSLGAVQVLYKLRACMPNALTLTYSALYLKTFAGKLSSSSILRKLLLSVKKVSSDVLVRMLDSVSNIFTVMPDSNENVFPDNFRDIQNELKALIGINNPSTHPLKSEYDIRNETLRTTVVAYKVELSKRKSQLSKHDTAYTKIIMQFHNLLESYFSDTLLGLENLFLHEILFYDLKTPHRDAFTPKPRFAIERALFAPHDYLNCNCCGATTVCAFIGAFCLQLGAANLRVAGIVRDSAADGCLISTLSRIWDAHQRFRSVVSISSSYRRSIRRRANDHGVILSESSRIKIHGHDQTKQEED